ncbi:cobalt ECF transporter T component CbiQ [Candidatus Poribacteria bacterium]|nr:cobalt ECF transporter T component CbiQ [Candidatus Poribacteria bacterium]
MAKKTKGESKSKFTYHITRNTQYNMNQNFLSHLLLASTQTKGRFHTLDPRIKLCAAVMMVVAIVLTPHDRFLEYALFALMLVSLLFISRLPISAVLKRSLLIIPFVLVVAIFLPFFKSGAILWEKHFLIHLKITQEGIASFVNILIKSYLSITTLILLALTTPFHQILKGLSMLRVPRLIIVILAFMYRYIFLLLEEASRMLKARESRNFGLSFWASTVNLANLIGVLFIRTYERGERVYAAMLSRGFDGTVVTLEDFKLAKSELFIGLGFAAVVILVKFLGEIYG